MDELKKGNIVGIWQRPFTQEKFEGKAELVQFIKKVPGQRNFKAEDWMVRFEGDEASETHRRTVTF